MPLENPPILKKSRKAIVAQPDSPDFLEVVDLLDLLSQAATGLAEIEASANGKLLELIKEYKTNYAKFQLAYSTAEAALETHCRKHPEWFVAAKSIATPYGKVSFHRSTKLVIKDAEATVRLILAKATLNLSQRTLTPTLPGFRAEDYVNVVKLPNLEALEKLDDRELDEFMITRERKENFKAEPAGVNFGKAVKESTKPEVQS